MNRACSFHANEEDFSSEVAASLGKSQFGKVLSCTVSVVKASYVQDGASTNCVKER